MITFIIYLIWAIVLSAIAGLIAFAIRVRYHPRLANHIAFFHPYCAGAGGGERVLWYAIKALQDHDENDMRISIYCATMCSGQSPKSIIDNVKRCFGIELSGEIKFVTCQLYWLIDPTYYPFLTLILQSFGSLIASIECLIRYRPGTFIDTTGFAFTYPVARYIFGCHVACYTHYPTISTDMLERVKESREAHNNRKLISSNPVLSYAKFQYYRLFAYLYGCVGTSAHVVMVNSSWTRDHILQIWQRPCLVVFPPCDTQSLSSLPLSGRSPHIISVAQFRPEKNHIMQLEAFQMVLKSLTPYRQNIRLILLGGVRNAEDQKRVERLRSYADQLGISPNIDWHINASFETLVALLGKSLIGLHTMWNEHFGIGVVEYMAAGLVTVAHNSGGPRSDIVIPFNGSETGFLADDSAQAFSEQITKVLTAFLNEKEDFLQLRACGRLRCQEFSDAAFCQGFVNAMAPILRNKH
uniref:GDP-Man:Man(3)GlcNAc(2)-PP-Dol alpha-1,2-mannosyltransferase n=1 Tax=Spongospora subterranea TaxID=70186 RepID=A0A0H5RBP6_9EUKA|eukprot:CRZ11211.1 hypothetical protein [Spongospora subterranea]